MIKTAVAEAPPDKGITIGQASKKYSIPMETISRWAERGVIVILLRKTTGRREVFLEEASMARAAALYKKQPGRGYRPLKFLEKFLEGKPSRSS